MVYAGCLILRGWDYRWTNWSNMINLVNLGMLSERYQTTHLPGQWMVMNVMDMRTGTVQTFLVVRKPQRLLWRVQAFSSMDFCFSLSRWWLVHLTGSTRGFRRCPKRPSIDASLEIGRRLYILILESFPTLSNHPSLGYEKELNKITNQWQPVWKPSGFFSTNSLLVYRLYACAYWLPRLHAIFVWSCCMFCRHLAGVNFARARHRRSFGRSIRRFSACRAPTESAESHGMWFPQLKIGNSPWKKAVTNNMRAPWNQMISLSVQMFVGSLKPKRQSSHTSQLHAVVLLVRKGCVGGVITLVVGQLRHWVGFRTAETILLANICPCKANKQIRGFP